MKLSDPRLRQTAFVVALAIDCLDTGMALRRVDQGDGTATTALALAFGAVAIVGLLAAVLLEIWRRPA